MAEYEDNSIEKKDEEIKQGATERKYPRTRTTSGYCIMHGEGLEKRFHVSDEDCEKSFLLYAVGKLTINQVATEMGWTREQFWALKQSFSITKTDILPFTPETIDSHTADELIEKVRIFKKQFATLKIKLSKYDDQRKEINRMNKTRFWFNEVLEAIQPLSTEPIFIPVQGKSEPLEILQYKVDTADIHNGLIIDSIFNRNSLEITEARMDFITNWIIQNIPTGSELLMSDLGDIVHGLIHGSTEKHSTWVTLAVNRICRAFVKMMKMLVDCGYVIKFGKVNGNHASLEKSKTSRTDEENFGNILPMVLEVAFLLDDRFEVIEKVKGMPYTVMETMFGYGILIAHGDEASMKKYKTLAEDIGDELGIKIIEVHCGHIHHYKAEDMEGVLVEYREAICGTDQYAGPKGLNAKPAFRVTTYGRDGRVGTRAISLKGVGDEIEVKR